MESASSTALPCPACRAANDLGPTCRRCKADLSLWSAVEAGRARAMAAAAREFTTGNLTAALTHADRADALRHGPDARRLQTLVHLLRRDFAQAWALHRAAR